MEQKIILLAETGSDITPEQANEYGIYLVPMHVTMGTETLDDGAFPPEDVCAYYDRTGTVPKTSASMPVDFSAVYDEIHRAHPDAQILHLAYSAITTCSFQNGIVAAEGRDYVTSVDTKHVSIGQMNVAIETAKYLRANPDATLMEVKAFAEQTAAKTQMCFLPKNLDYLRAGGRVSNAVALVGNILGLHPCIEIIDGKLMAKKKYRGSLKKQVPKLIDEFTTRHALRKDLIYFIQSPGLEDEVKEIAEEHAAKLGYHHVVWTHTGCVITCHGGPGCFGIVGMNE